MSFVIKLFVLTGAGISAESGIPVFQGTNWRGHSHYELANIDAWQRDPEIVWEYYSERRLRARDVNRMPLTRLWPNSNGRAPAHGSFSALRTSMDCTKLPGQRVWCTSTASCLRVSVRTTVAGQLFPTMQFLRCIDCRTRAPQVPNVCWFGEQPFAISFSPLAPPVRCNQ